MTPTLEQVLKDAIRASLLDTHTSFPGKVVSYDAKTQKAVIKPLIKRKYVTDGTTVELPELRNVPVQTTSGSSEAFIYVPIKAGCLGMVNICERSIDAWLAGTGQTFEPDDPRHHDLSDAWFVPGVRPFKKALVVEVPDSIIIKNGQMTVTIDPSGKISINGVAEELLGLLKELIDIVSSAGVVVTGSTGVMDPATISLFTTLKTRLTTLCRT